MKKPYQYRMSANEFFAMWNAVAAFKQAEEAVRPAKYQFILTQRKAVTYGTKFSVSLLSCSPGFMDGQVTGMSQEQWDGAKARLTALLGLHLKVEASTLPFFRNDAWTPERKFWLCFEVYIQYTELCPS